MIALRILTILLSAVEIHALNERPVVAIVAGNLLAPHARKWPDATGYIAASYVKWLEQEGARVTYILTTWSDEAIVNKFDSVDGVLFPGGEGNLTHGRYAEVTRALVRLTYAYNARNPGSRALWGTCLGLETIAVHLASSGIEILTKSEGTQSVSLRTIPTADCMRSDRSCYLLGPSTPAPVMHAFDNDADPVAFHWHKVSIYERDFRRDTALAQRLRIVATSSVPEDERGPFVAALEDHDTASYPVFGTMFHPEMAAFELSNQTWHRGLRHSAASIDANNYIAKRFVSALRRGTTERPGNIDHWIVERSTSFAGRVNFYPQVYIFYPTD